MRFEYSTEAHFASLFPVVQQVVGVATILSSVTRAVSHVAQLAFNKMTSGSRGSLLREKLEADKEGIKLGAMRMVPIYASFVSFIMLMGLDRSEGGPLFRRLAAGV